LSVSLIRDDPRDLVAELRLISSNVGAPP